MNNLMHIQSYLNGKSKKAVESAVAQKVISFDKNRYRLCKSDKTISTYIAEFTTSYQGQMQKILGEGEFSKNVFIKLDNILTEGFEFSNSEVINIYTDTNDAVKECEKQNVIVYHFNKDEQQREVLVCKGELVKGSLTMVLRKSDYIESGTENISSRRQYVMELFGVGKEVGSFITGRLKDYDDDKYDEHIEQVFEACTYLLNNLSHRTDALIGYKKLLFSTSRNTIRNTIYNIVGSNEEIVNLLVPLFYRGYSDCVNFTRDLLVAGMRQKLQEIIDDEDIDEYRVFVNGAGDISIAAEITGLEKEILQFIMDYGNEDDFKFYMTVHYKISNVESEKTLDENILDNLYENLSKKIRISGEQLTAPISYTYIQQILDMVNRFSIEKKNKEKLINKFFDECHKSYNFDLQVISRLLSDKRYTKPLRFELAFALLSHDNILDVYEKHPSIKNMTTEQLSDDVLSCKSCEEVKNKLSRKYNNASVLDDKVNVINRLYGVDVSKTITLTAKAKEYYQNLLSQDKFEKECSKLANNIISTGISQNFTSNSISVVIKKNENSCNFSFADASNHTKVRGLNNVEFKTYKANCRIANIAKKVEQIYKNALNISSNAERLTYFGMLPPKYNFDGTSPDSAIMSLINDTNFKLKLASDDTAIPSFLMDENGNYINAEYLPKLITLVRTTYCEMFEYEGMLKNQQKLSFENLFNPVVYSIHTKKIIPFSNAICNEDGDVYIGIEPVFQSEKLRQIYQQKEVDKVKSKSVLDKFAELGTDDCIWEERIEFIEQHIQVEDICRNDLFIMIHSLELEDNGMDWLKSILEDVDDNMINDIKEFEKNSPNRNFSIINL